MGIGNALFQQPADPIPWTPETAVADGEASSRSIQSMVDARPSTIIVGPGTYPENVSISVSGLTVVGTGAGTIIDGSLEITASNVDVRNLEVTGKTEIRNEPDGVTVENLRTWADTPTAVEVLSGEGVSLERVRVNGAPTTGIRVGPGGNFATIERPEVGGKVAGDAVVNEADGSRIDGAEIRGNGGNGIVDHSTDSVINVATVTSVTGDGILVDGTDQGLFNCRVTASGGVDINDANATTLTRDGNISGSSTGSTVDYINDFETDSLAPYSENTHEMDTTDAFASHGSYSLVSTGGAYSRIYSLPGDGLNAYPALGDYVYGDFRTDTLNPYQQFLFGFSDLDNYYQARFNWGAGEVGIQSESGGDIVARSFSNVALNANETYSWELDWSSIKTLYVFDSTGTQVASPSLDDQSNDGGEGVGHVDNCDSTETVYHDNIRMDA